MAADFGATVYRGMSRAYLSAAYNNGAAVPDSPDWLEKWRKKSVRIRALKDAELNVRYGSAARTFFDYFPCGRENAPLFIFIHGGYWQRNHKDMFAFIAEGPLTVGFNVATLGYSLAPEASLTVIVEEMRTALTFFGKSANEFGFHGDKIIVGGWSAGGHLAASLMDHPAVSAVLAISGIFDLEPIALGELNDALQLTPKEIQTLSPARRLPGRSIPVCVSYGDLELPELQRQSAEFIDACRAHEMDVRPLPLDGHHHFSILDEFKASQGHLLKALRQLARR